MSGRVYCHLFIGRQILVGVHDPGLVEARVLTAVVLDVLRWGDVGTGPNLTVLTGGGGSLVHSGRLLLHGGEARKDFQYSLGKITPSVLGISLQILRISKFAERYCWLSCFQAALPTTKIKKSQNYPKGDSH